ncbi:von Willebrand factor C domain-containing protein 2-like [Physella acuta]|uniref:von Willebrand factor C domain-containing protein 2-like n=1 Tax=Physella acuta TaxID=109671 RepID=UPI0027DDCDE7|nr:von Willebrand factor C domain-containing protein 2-like [Physella acuta]
MASVGVCLALGLVLIAGTKLSTAQKCTHQDGKQFQVGHHYFPDLCTDCFCEPPGMYTCTTIECPVLLCVDSVQLENECCPSCVNGPSCSTASGVVIPLGLQVKINNGSTCHCVPDLQEGSEHAFTAQCSVNRG